MLRLIFARLSARPPLLFAIRLRSCVTTDRPRSDPFNRGAASSLGVQEDACWAYH